MLLFLAGALGLMWPSFSRWTREPSRFEKYIRKQDCFLGASGIRTYGSLNDEHSNCTSTILEIYMSQDNMTQDNKDQPQHGGQSNSPGQQGPQPGQKAGQQTQQPSEKPGQDTEKRS